MSNASLLHFNAHVKINFPTLFLSLNLVTTRKRDWTTRRFSVMTVSIWWECLLQCFLHTSQDYPSKDCAHVAKALVQKYPFLEEHVSFLIVSVQYCKWLPFLLYVQYSWQEYIYTKCQNCNRKPPGWRAWRWYCPWAQLFFIEDRVGEGQDQIMNLFSIWWRGRSQDVISGY